MINGISVLIPCAGRVTLLEELLKSVHLARQDFLYPTEVLLLDNSRIEEKEKVKKLAEKFGVSYHDGSNNISQKRNQGAELASYNLILFLDSDCMVDRHILQEHFNAYTSSSIGGCLGLLRFVGEDTDTWKSVERTGVLGCFHIADDQKSTIWGPTANISFRRDAFLAVEGFDIAFSQPGGEDVDLGIRLSNAGWQIVCNSGAIAYHTKKTWSSFWQVYERFLRYGAADALLIKKHLSHTMTDFPLSTHYAALLLLFALLWVPLTGFYSLVLPILWAISSVLIYAVLTQNRTVVKEEVSWYISAQELILLSSLDIGRLIGAFKHRAPSAFYKRIIFFDEQLSLDWPGVSFSSLASILALIISLTGFSFLIGLMK